MAVQVDICGAGFVCLADRCHQRAWLVINSDRTPARMRYCADDLVGRAKIYAGQGRAISYSREARALLLANGRPVIT